MNEPAIGIIGGSGLYHLEGFSNLAEHKIDTPFGAPSDPIVGGTMFGRSVYFLPRHGRGHRILPQELNHRANIYALRSLNVRWIISVTAVGSLQEKYAPRDAKWAEHHALDSAIITDRKLWPAATIKKLGPIIERFLYGSKRRACLRLHTVRRPTNKIFARTHW